MPPRHAYWTILIDDQPTAFRAHDPEELLPTLNRLREKNETAVMKWFERGQLFDSRDAARDAGLGKGERRWEGPRPERRDLESPAAPARRADRDERRDKSWRPGGEHRDPRQKYKDAKKAKWNRFKDKIRERHEQRGARDPETFSPPHGDPLREKYRDRPPGPASDRDDRPAYRDARREDRDGAPSRPHGDKYRQPPRPRSEWRPREDDRRPPRPREPRFESREPDRGERRGPARPAWRDDRRPEWRDRPPRREDDRRDWRPKSPAGAAAAKRKPFGAKPGGPPRSGPPRGGSGRKPPFGKKPFGSKPPGGRRRRDEDE